MEEKEETNKNNMVEGSIKINIGKDQVKYAKYIIIGILAIVVGYFVIDHINSYVQRVRYEQRVKQRAIEEAKQLERTRAELLGPLRKY